MPKVAILLPPGFSDWEYALIGGTGHTFYGVDVCYFALEPGDVVSQGGLVARVPNSIHEVRAWCPDALVVIGSMIWESTQAPDVSALLGLLHAGGVTVAGICGGTLALARAGLLNECLHTSNSAEFLVQYVQEYRGHTHYQERATAVSTQRVITAAGTSPVSFTAAVFESVGVHADQVAALRQMMAAEHIQTA